MINLIIVGSRRDR